MDFKLDNEFGDQVIEEAKRICSAQLDPTRFELLFVGLSSTEDTSVKKRFESQGVLKLFPKPTRKTYVQEMIE